MEFFIWNDSYFIGIDIVDNQHKKLISIMNLLFESVARINNDLSLDKILEELINYTETHFKTEEDLFVDNSYPDYIFHKHIHDKFKIKIFKLKEKFQNTNDIKSVQLDTFLFLKNWLTNHILVQDKKYAPFLIEKGIK